MPESGRAMGGVPDVARRATAVLSASALAASCHGPTAAFCCCRSHPSERSRLGPRWDAIRWGSPFAQRLQPQLCLTLAYGSAARWVGRRAGAAAREGRAPLGGPASGPSLLPSEAAKKLRQICIASFPALSQLSTCALGTISTHLSIMASSRRVLDRVVVPLIVSRRS